MSNGWSAWRVNKIYKSDWSVCDSALLATAYVSSAHSRNMLLILEEDCSNVIDSLTKLSLKHRN